MKKQIFLVSLLALTTAGFSQTWGGSGNQSNNAYRTGYVGIGNSSPVDHLHVTSVSNNGITITQNTYGAAALTLENTKLGGHKYHIGSNSADNGQGAGSFSIYDVTENKDRFTIKNSGRVGIGTWGPSDQIQVLTSSASESGISITQNYDAASALTLDNQNSNKVFSLRVGGTSDILGAGNFSIYDNSNYLSRLFIKGSNGAVGLGNTNPMAYLHLTTPAATGQGLLIEHNDPNAGYGSEVRIKNNNTKAFVVSNAVSTLKEVFKVYGTGRTVIGEKTSTSHPTALLSVSGDIVAQALYVTPTSDWPDYVFNKAYKLPNLYDIESYYLIHKHLPEVPSEKEIQENGIDVGSMNAILLKKIEEMTILMVRQQKEIDALKEKNK